MPTRDEIIAQYQERKAKGQLAFDKLVSEIVGQVELEPVVLEPVGTIESLTQRILACSRCELRKEVTAPVPGIYLVGCKYFIIGEAPGRTEDKYGTPFIGPAGKKLDQLLAVAGIDPNTCSFDNTIKCRLPMIGLGKLKKGRDPRKGEIRACWPFLLEAIKLCKPEILITLGRIPLGLFSEYGIKQLHGTQFVVEINEDGTLP